MAGGMGIGGGTGGGSIEMGKGYDYEMGGAPKKKEKVSKTSIGSTVGKNVVVVRAGKRLPVEAGLGSKPFRLESGDRVETGDGSYAFGFTDVPTGDNPCTSIIMFPGSAVEIATRHRSAGNVEGGADVITKVEFIEGMISFAGPCEFVFKKAVPVKFLPTVMGKSIGFCAEIRKDGSVAFFRSIADIEHTRAKVRAKLLSKETVVTDDALYDLPALEPRYEEAYKVFDLLVRSQGAQLGRMALAHPGPSVEDFKKVMQGTIAANVAQMKKELAENEYLPREVVADYKKQIADFEAGKGVSAAFAVKDEAGEKGKQEARKQSAQKMASDGDAALAKLATLRLPSPQPLDKGWMVQKDTSERRTMGADDYMRHAWATSAKVNELEAQMRAGKISKSEFAAKRKKLDEEAVAPMKKSMEHIANIGKEGKPMMDAVSAKAKIGKSVQYGAILVEAREAEKGPEFRMVKCPQGSLFVAVSVRLENTKSAATAYIVPDEEMWLSYGASAPLKPENYKFETALDAKKPTEGYVWYIVPSDAKKFSLMMGKKTMPKVPVDFSL